MNRRKLLLLIAMLAVLGYGYSYLSVAPKKMLVKKNIQLVRLVTDDLNRIMVYFPSHNTNILLLKVNEKKWLGTVNQTTVELDHQKVENFIDSISSISSNEVETTDKSNWEKYQIDPINAIDVRLFANSHQLDQLIFSRNCENDASFLRMNKGFDVYKISGCFSKYFEQGLDYFRNHQLTSFTPEKVSAFGWINAKDESTNFYKNGTKWIYKKKVVPSKDVERFLKKISSLNGQDFADDIDESALDDAFYGKLKLDGMEMYSPIEISCYYDKDHKHAYLFKSNLNPNTYFRSDSLGLFTILFKDNLIDKITHDK